MSAPAISPYRVQAYNTAVASENKIHDDTVARRFGFAGGLVPGIEVYAYMAHIPVARAENFRDPDAAFTITMTRQPHD